LKWRLRIGGSDHEVEAAWSGEGVLVTLGDREIHVRVHPLEGPAIVLRQAERRIAAVAIGKGAERHLWVNGRTIQYEVVDTRRRATAAGPQHDLVGSVPGTVRRVLVKEGDIVTAGQVLVIVESMKMEMSLAAPHDGVVEAVLVAEGEAIEAGAHLIKLADPES